MTRPRPAPLRPRRTAGAAAALWLGAVLAASAQERVTVFHAAVFEPVFAAVRPGAEKTLGVRLLTESGGSLQLLRRFADLGRDCDLMMLADPVLFRTVPAEFTWRLDIAGDEMVLAIGQRAPRTDEAEKDWAAVVLDPAVRLARADETLAPLGYRTLLVWQLVEQGGRPGFAAALREKTKLVVDDAGRVAALLKSGDVDYAFLYRTTCVAHAIRFIPLDPAVNLGAPDRDYSRASVTYPRRAGGRVEDVTVRGEPIVYSLSIPARAPRPDRARALVRHVLENRGADFDRGGFVRFKPRFYGPAAAFAPWADLAERKGEEP